ncbi:Heparin-sulfate lyase precursor [Symmachiella macrocystis]|uniref:Heparin-sulfate lyase n=1 Tax=Symmachiella macrocystis TaxID=2527985 RepID=A0A5C6B638_9PLAN|nr:heparinase II/III family protein [Symmachiella macrocystis]TWU06971.1 Heparin-sulfate lyase precursor [Symmachiella macrocystis]
MPQTSYPPLSSEIIDYQRIAPIAMREGLEGPPVLEFMHGSHHLIRSAVRWCYLLRYHRPQQFGNRLLMKGRRSMARLRQSGVSVHEGEQTPAIRDDLAGLQSMSRHKQSGRQTSDSAQNANRVAGDRYRFLNLEAVLPDPIDWRLEKHPHLCHLWRFHLHYHEFLLDLATHSPNMPSDCGMFRCWEIAKRWIGTNQLSDVRVVDDAWHPFCISRRLPVWITLFCTSPPPPEDRDLILRSMAAQALYLEQHLERDLGGNHLLENAKALALCGAFFEGEEAEQWLSKADVILRYELDCQILPHGEHFERSPMYHAQMLEAVLDVREAVKRVRPALAQRCSNAAEKMADFLSVIVHPDGDIPLLADSCLGETAACESLIAHANESHQTSPLKQQHKTGARKIGDYWTWRDEADYLLFDRGPVGANDLPAHAHGDLLNLEASLNGHRVIVDSGVFSYGDDAMRRYSRSTAAHNVLQIDDCDQCDMWSKFRMGYRGWPGHLTSGTRDGIDWAHASHNAYRRLGVPRIDRWVICRQAGGWFVVDQAHGTKRHTLTNRLHLHADVIAVQESESTVRLIVNSDEYILASLTPGNLRITEGWFCPEFGKRIPAPVVEWSTNAALPAVSGWSLTKFGSEIQAEMESTDNGTILLNGIDAVANETWCLELLDSTVNCRQLVDS